MGENIGAAARVMLNFGASDEALSKFCDAIVEICMLRNREQSSGMTR
jgi:tRNA C32,U32 (ribose-2'-O)-methylase TrmJ